VEHFETKRQRKDGRLIDVSVTVSPIKDAEGRIIGASKVARDITERRRIEEALQASEGRYRTLFEHAPDGILITDAQSYCLDANASICRMLGYTRDELIGLHARDIVAPAEIENIEPALDSIRTHPEYAREWQFRRKDGTVFPSEVIATQMPDGTLLAMIREITERRNAEQALRDKDLLLHESDRRLAEIVHGMTEACFALDRDWRFTFVNDRGETLLRHRRQEMLGKSIWEVFAQLVGTPMEAQYRSAMTERVPAAFEVFSPIAERWLDIRLFPTAEGLAAFLLDIQDRKLGEAALHEREHQFQTMVNAIPQLAWTAHADGVIYWYNERWYQYTGTTPAQMEVRGWQSVHDPAALPKVMAQWQQALDSSQPVEMEFPLRGADGQFRTFLTRVHPLKDAAGKVVQWFGIARQQVDQLNAELENRVVERTAQLEAANKELEAFSYSVSHDLRAPLRAVDGFSQAVVEDYGALLPAEGRRQLQVIRESAQQMGQLVDDLLSFSRLSRQPLNCQTVHVEQQVRQVLADLQPEYLRRNVRITIGDLPPCQGDRALVQRVWVNLLSNALKYSSKREHPTLEIGCLHQDNHNVYFVRDNGTGFDMRYAGKLFGVFHRLHRAEDYEGTGVGLAIVQRVVHRHGGRVWAQAEVDRGATFFFTLEGEIKT
jgi:PAS domain S-box-containing protein